MQSTAHVYRLGIQNKRTPPPNAIVIWKYRHTGGATLRLLVFFGGVTAEKSCSLSVSAALKGDPSAAAGDSSCNSDVNILRPSLRREQRSRPLTQRAAGYSFPLFSFF